MEGRRRRGRPRKQYIDNIQQWTQLTTSQRVLAAEDRSRWKQLVSQAMHGGQRSDVICRKEEESTLMFPTSVPVL